MRVLSEDPKTVEVIIRAQTTILLEDLVVTITSRAGTSQSIRVLKAEANWDYAIDHWSLGFVHITGPILRKDGSDGKRQASVSTHPPERERTPTTPPEILAVVEEHAPDWTPELNDPGWTRTPPGWFRSSL